MIWKFAATMDGRSAALDGTSQWITSPDARADVQELRSTVDAIIVGVGTVLADDPHLTARNRRRRAGQPAAAAGRRRHATAVPRPTPGSATAPPAPGSPPRPRSAPAPDGRVDLRALGAALYERGCRRVLLEGGPTLAGAFLREGLVDEVVGYVAPKLLGAGPPRWPPPASSPSPRPSTWSSIDVRRVGPDLRITALPKGR